MGAYDAATWSAVGFALTACGLVLSVLVWRSRGMASGLRGIAWSLLPLAAALTGLLRVVWEVADSVSTWAARLVFSPSVWVGVAVAGVSAALFVVSGVLRRRTPKRAGRKQRKQAAVAGTETPSVSGGRPAPAATKPEPDDDMADIEAILKKHGIS